MKKTAKKLLLITIAALTVAALTSCGLTKKLDVVGRGSVTSFEAVLEGIPQNVEHDEMNAGWSLSAPDGTVRFIWSGDYSRSPIHDVMLEISAEPFINAGLDTDKLPDSILFYGDKLMVGKKLGNDKPKESSKTPLDAYKQIVDLHRDSIGYHMALDHYGVNLGDGNMFEWAKDMDANDKDIVFVLNPEPLIKAGVDPDKVEGWAFSKVPVEMDGKNAEVDKLLKPFNLK